MRQNFFLFIFLVPLFSFGQIEKGETQEEMTITIIENPPEFPGGHKALTRYVQNYVVKATGEIEDIVEGVVFVTFWVETDGSITDPEILRGLTPELDSISIDLMKSMPKWSPATQRGKPIRVKFNLPVRFSSQAVKQDD
jgi:periplasmic protein TonB